MPRIVVLGLSSPADQMRAFEEALRALGHVNGSTITIERRSAEGREDALPALARETVALNPRVVVAVGTKAAFAAQQATRELPIVAVAGDVVAAGLVKSMGRPEGNLTGLSFFSVDLMLKRFEVLLDLAPKTRRLAVLVSGRPILTVQRTLSALDTAARKKSIEVRSISVERPEDLKPALARIRGGAGDGLLVTSSPDFDARAAEIGQLTAEHRLIAVLPWKEYVLAGGLASYAPDIVALWRRAGGYVDRILRGARPGDLPVEQPTTFELVINMRTARALGLTVPPALLLRADQVLE